MQIIIDINSTKTQTKRGTSSKTGKPYEIISQRGFLHSLDTITGDVTPVAIDIPVGRDGSPYETGRYTLDVSSIIVSAYGALQIGRLKLVKLPPAVAAQRAA